ncbi:hypothetical protein PLESTB_000383500 [Pleodorina starrii]|uniref:Fungal lipase-type domain-containing protein n=1 Tax=Pleodorina starrii TaxID=330485 RepID=A0A9W6BE46_9CHLO|nr:hypothetical protein PLESTM_000011500 [Pleodorina starrii]GLC50477.1 hypothetical protein PLESTB_000383500 [Pleodorina starrii]
MFSLTNAILASGDPLRLWRDCPLLAWQIWRNLQIREITATLRESCYPGCAGSHSGSTTNVRLASTDSSAASNPETRLPATSAAQMDVPRPPPSKRTIKALGRRRDAGSAGGGGSPPPAELSSPGLLSVLGAMAGLFRAGVGGAGLGVGHATFGLQALARLHEAQALSDHPAGRRLGPGAATQGQAERLLDALELAHGAYRRSAAALAATTCLRAHHVRVWRPEGGSLQPGYYLAVDHFGRRVVWGVRGTRVFADLLTDLAMAAHPLGSGAAHWGMTHAAHWMLQREVTRVAALLRSLGPVGSYRLQLVGHSLGGSVAALAAVMLREQLVEVARTAAIPPELISCVAFAPAAAMSPPLAELCRPYVTSVVLNNDIVPRFNAASLARLHEELREVDWYSELQRTVMDHTLVKSLSTTLEALTPTSPSSGPSAARALPQPQPQPQQQPQTPQPDANVPATSITASAASAGGMAQQLSAALLESAAFKSAVQALDEWKARAVAAAGDQAEAAMRRQLELVQAWLQDVAAANRTPFTAASASGPKPPALQGRDGGQREDDGAAAADVRRAAEAAAERLRQSVESAMASLTAAAAASRDRLSASLPSLPPLPSLPSLPQPHELPLVETRSAAAAAAAAAASASVPTSPAAAAAGERVVAADLCASSWDGATAAEVAGEAEAAVTAAGAAASAALAAPAAAHPDQVACQELPLLLPPGRILYIRAAQQQGELPSSSAEAGDQPGDGVDGDGGGGGGGGGGMAAASRPAGHYVMLELPPGEGFRRLILGRSALEEHQCRAYRRVLTQLAFREEPV